MIKIYAYATLLIGDFHFNSLLGLVYSLDKVETKYPIIIIFDKNTLCKNNLDFLLKIQSQLKTLKIILKDIKANKFHDEKIYNFNYTINKFEILNCINFKKILFLDADVIVLKNLDFIFLNYDLLFTEQLNGENFFFGGLFLLQPSKKIFNFILDNRSKWNNDEEVLHEIYYQNLKNNLNEIMNNNFYNFIFHDGGYLKYWNLYNYNNIKDIFYNNNIIDIYKLLKIYNDKVKSVISKKMHLEIEKQYYIW